MAKADPITLSYLAGCLDSDGYLTIARDLKNVNNGTRVAPEYKEMIGLRQVTPEVPILLKKTFGGSVSQAAPSHFGGKILWSWVISSRKAASAVRDLLPYLRIKKDRASILLKLRAFKDHREIHRNRRGHLIPITVEEMTEANDLYKLIRFINSGEVVV